MSSVDPSAAAAAASPPDEQKDFYHFVYLMLPFTWNLFGRTNLHATNFVSWDLKKRNFFKRIEGVIQFYSQRGKQIVLRKLGWGNFHAININFCEVSWHLSALNFSCKSYILQPAVLNISESTNYHSLKRCSPKLILLVNTGIQIRVQKYKTAFAQRSHYYFGMQLWT